MKKIKIGLHKADKNWYKYFKPVWLNCISYKFDKKYYTDVPKIYKWLFWYIAIIE